MKTKFAPSWKASVQPRKQRKYRYNAPLHVKGKFLRAHLAKSLRERHGVRSARVRAGDKVRVLRGTFKGREGKVDRVDLKNSRIYIAKVEMVKKDGATKVQMPITPSNCMIVELDLSDKRRAAKLTKK
jgi:large subunit ribosomal protein L24